MLYSYNAIYRAVKVNLLQACIIRDNSQKLYFCDKVKLQCICSINLKCQNVENQKF